MHIKTSDTPCADVLHNIINTYYIQIKYDYNMITIQIQYIMLKIIL